MTPSTWCQVSDFFHSDPCVLLIQYTVPVAAIVADRVDTTTLARSYRALNDAILEEAQRVLKDNRRLQGLKGKESKEKEMILDGAKHIVRHGLDPLGFMIDKNEAGRKAIDEGESHLPLTSGIKIEVHYPEVYGIQPRVCQFHVIQAIVRWTTDSGPLDGDERPAVSNAYKADMLNEFVSGSPIVVMTWSANSLSASFRVWQRTRPQDVDNETEWQQAADELKRRILKTTKAHYGPNGISLASGKAKKKKASQASGVPPKSLGYGNAEVKAIALQVFEYLERNFLCKRWRSA